MLELITAVYGLLCWLVFKKFKLIAINDYTVVTAVLIPIVTYLFGFLLINMNAPVANDVRLVAPETPIVSLVQGRVAEVVAEPNTPVKMGDVLLKIDDTLYQARLKQAEAQLEFARTRLDQAIALEKKGVGSRNDRLQFESEVRNLEGRVDEARFNLDNCVIVAPADGMVTQLLVRPGQFVMPVAFNQIMIFVHDEQTWLGSFPQQTLQGMKDGQEAEIAVTAAPGHVFSAEVYRIVPVIGEGLLTASGKAIKGEYDRPPGRVLVKLRMTDPRVSQFNFPVGTDAAATIFSADGHMLKFIRGLILRIKSWENWIFI